MKNTAQNPFITSVKIRFHDADPAGIMFYGNIFTMVHDVFEDFIVHCGVEWKTWFFNPVHFVPIRHAECEFLAPFFPGETYLVQAAVNSISSSTFKMEYTFSSSTGPHAIVKIAHTFADFETKTKKAIPTEFRSILQAHLKK